jgi:hypothetical protein
MSDGSPALPDELIDQILRGQPIDIKAPREAHLLAEWVEALRRPARPNELRGAPLAVAAFRWAKSPSGRLVSRPRQLRIPMRIGVAGAAVFGALIAGVAVAAATGSLPAPLQAVAHVFFGAPAPSAGKAGGNDPAGSAGVIELPAEFPPLIPSHPPPVGTSTPSASPDPASGQPDVSTEPSALAPKGTDTHSAAGRQGAIPGDTTSEQPESSGGPAAEATPKDEHQADVRPETTPTPPRARPGGRPADQEPKGPPSAEVEPQATPLVRPETPGPPPRDVERKAGPPADVEDAGTPPAPAVELSEDPTKVVEQRGEE